jgi:hypothetical protein
MKIRQLQINYLERQRHIIEGIIELYGDDRAFKEIRDNIADFIELLKGGENKWEIEQL